MDTAKLIHEIEAAGTTVWLKANGKIGLKGGPVARAAERIASCREEIVAFLASRQSAPTAPRWDRAN